jgi:hypothetical protein
MIPKETITPLPYFPRIAQASFTREVDSDFATVSSTGRLRHFAIASIRRSAESSAELIARKLPC